MNWGTSIGTGFATGFIGAMAAVALSATMSAGRGDSSEDKTWLAFFTSILGFGAAFVLGVIVSRFSGGGFLRAAGISAGFVIALASVGSVLVNRANYSPVTIRGEGVVLQVEMQLPDSNRGADYSCWLSPNGDRGLGSMRSNRAQQQKDSRWVIPCSFELRSTHKQRLISLATGGTGKAGFPVTLPEDSSSELNERWSLWSSGSTDPRTRDGSSAYKFRLRFVRESVAKVAEQGEREARFQERWRQFDSIAQNAPLERYLDSFEPDSDMAAGEIPANAAAKMAALVKKKPAAFEQALRSEDRELVRKAIYALAATPQIPREITPALVDAGHQVASYVDSARSKNLELKNDDADKAALPFLDRWDQALDHAEPPINRADFLAILDEIQKASGQRHSTFRTDLPSRVAMKIDEMTAKRRQ